MALTKENMARAMIVAISIAFSVYFYYLIAPFMKMFLLDEYRQWTFNIDMQRIYNYMTLEHFLDLSGTANTPSIVNSRSLSYLTAMLFGEVCGARPQCHNDFHLALIILATLFAVLTIRRLSTSKSWLPLLLTAVSVLISVPVLEAVSWQATILDKLAMLLTSIVLLIAASVDVEHPTRSGAIITNVCLGIVVVAAYNAKEAAFFLAPAATMLIASRALSRNIPVIPAATRALSLTALPLIYATLHVGLVYYNRVYIDATEFHRVTGGDPVANLYMYLQYLFDLLGLVVSPLEIGVILSAFLVVVLFAAIVSILQQRRTVPLLLWALIACACSLAISLRTSIPSSFYLLVPLLYFGLLIGLTADAILTAKPNGLTKMAFVSLCLLFLLARAYTIRASLPWFDHLAELSTNFRGTLDKLRSELAADPARRIFLVTTSSDIRTFMLIGRVRTNNALSSFLLSPTASRSERLSLDGSIFYVPYPEQPPATLPGDLRAFLGPNLELNRLERTPERTPVNP